LIILTNVVFFMFELSMDESELNHFISQFGLTPTYFLHHWGQSAEVGTLFTSMFLHGGWMHLISNMWALWIFGDNIEDRLGHWRYLFFYLLCGVVAGLTQAFADPSQTAPTVGASGAIAGVLGAYLMLYPNSKVVTLIPLGFIPWFVNIPAYIFLGIWFFVQLSTGWFSLHVSGTNVAFFAHVGGFVTGFALVRLWQKPDYRRFWRDEYWPY